MSVGRIKKRIVGTLAGTALLSAAVLSAGAGSASAASHGTKVALRKVGHHGKVLVAPNGHSLYDFSVDTRNKSHCGVACQLYWKPLMTKGRPVAGTGVRQSLLGQTSKHQVTYAGKPLYTYTRDKRAGQAMGEDEYASSGYWYLVNAKGHSVV